MDQQKLGMAIQRDHRSIVIETSPGHRVSFPGGQAIIRNELDMIHLLRREDLIIHIDEWIDFLPRWLNRCGWEHPAKAMLELPHGYTIKKEGDEFVLQTVRRPGRPPKSAAQSEIDEPILLEV